MLIEIWVIEHSLETLINLNFVFLLGNATEPGICMETRKTRVTDNHWFATGLNFIRHVYSLKACRSNLRGQPNSFPRNDGDTAKTKSNTRYPPREPGVAN